MELLQLTYFKTVAETGKIVTAADKLFVSPPAISTSISKLEKELGVQLFDRENGRITLNKQGSIFLRYVIRILNTAEAAKEEVRQSLLHQQPSVYIAVTNPDLWVDMIAAFMRKHPIFALSSLPQSVSQLEKQGLPQNCAFLLADEADIPKQYAAEYDSRVLFEDHPAVLVHRSHALAQRESVTLQELVDERLFLPTKDQSLWQRFSRLFQENSIPIPDTHSFSSQICYNMVSHNLGISFTTLRARWQAGINVRCIRLETDGRPWTQRIYWRRDRAMTRDDLTFRSFVERFYDRTPAKDEPEEYCYCE